MLDALYRAWQDDTAAGRLSLMIAQDVATVVELNRRARGDRLAAGGVEGSGVPLADGLEAGVGDVVVTRRNDRRLRLGEGAWVRNRDRWVVTAAGTDGSLAVRRASGTETVVLPAGYVAGHVELGYATTAWGAQGMTADTAHAMVSPAMTGEVLYVAATRGREANLLYVDVCAQPAQPEMAHGPGQALEVRDVLVAVAGRRAAEPSAHRSRREEKARASGLERLAVEHHSLVAAATAGRWEPVVEGCGLDPAALAAARASLHWPALLATLQAAEHQGLDPEAVIGQLAAAPVGPERDPSAVLRARLLDWAGQAAGGRSAPPATVAGVVPRAQGIADPDLARAVRECEQAIAGRARELGEDALTAGSAWARRLGSMPRDPARRAAFVERVVVVAAYRDRWGIHSDTVLGDAPSDGSPQQLAHHNRALRAGQDALRLAGHHAGPGALASRPSPPVIDRGPQL